MERMKCEVEAIQCHTYNILGRVGRENDTDEDRRDEDDMEEDTLA